MGVFSLDLVLPLCCSVSPADAERLWCESGDIVIRSARRFIVFVPDVMELLTGEGCITGYRADFPGRQSRKNVT
jgi:hypothetical protein